MFEPEELSKEERALVHLHSLEKERIVADLSAKQIRIEELESAVVVLTETESKLRKEFMELGNNPKGFQDECKAVIKMLRQQVIDAENRYMDWNVVIEDQKKRILELEATLENVRDNVHVHFCGPDILHSGLCLRIRGVLGEKQ